MILRNVRLAADAVSTRHVDRLEIRHGRLHFDPTASGGPAVDLTGYLMLPGLINAHDHLEFNLFPQLGTRRYRNAREWAHDVYRPEQEPVRSHRAVHRAARLQWGAIKNLLSGVTTVAHHNPYEPEFGEAFPVRVPQRYGWAHSLNFSPDLLDRFLGTPAAWPFIVHAAEGTDDASRNELERLDRMGILTGRTIVVHALAATPNDWQRMAARGTAAVWCPTSNLSLYGATIPREAFTSGVLLALGTDSALSAETTLAGEIARAHREFRVPLPELYRMVTAHAARMLRLSDGEGGLSDGGAADFCLVRDCGQTPSEALLDLRAEAVAVRGEIRMAKDSFAAQLPAAGLHRLHVEKLGQVFLKLNLPSLLEQTSKILGSEIRLAGQAVSA